jgi:hypothetical protein
VKFPSENWPIQEDRHLVEDFVAAFPDQALVLTDKLTNSVWFSPAAEELLGDRALALVNRVAFSLLGFDDRERQPTRLVDALLGEAEPWRGVVHLPCETGKRLAFVEASAIRKADELVCGIIRLKPQESPSP